MEPHPDAWLRSRVHGMYTYDADDGLDVTVLRRSAYLFGEAALFREPPEWEMAGFRDDILLRDGAGRGDGLAVTVLRRSAVLLREAELFREESEWEMAGFRDDILLRHGAGRGDGLAVTVLRRSAVLFREAELFREASEWEMARFGDDILLRDGAGRDGLAVTVLRRCAFLFREAAPFREAPEWEMAVIRDDILLLDGAGRDGLAVTVLGRSAFLFREAALFRDEPEVGMAVIGDGVLLGHGADRWNNGVRFVAREAIPGQLKCPGRDDVLLNGTGTSYSDTVTLMAMEPGDGAGQMHKKKAAADIFLALGDRGDWKDRPFLALAVGPMYWVQELTDWVYRLMGSPRYRERDEWSWQFLMGQPIEQHDGTCVICASLVCLEALHRLDWERRYGYGTFPYHIPVKTVEDMKDLCHDCGVWTAKYGAYEEEVLDLFQEVGGCAAASDVPGWKTACKLQLKGKTCHPSSKRQPMAASKLKRLIHEEGPLLGAIVVDKQTYYEWMEHYVYRGLPTGHKGGGGHLVVCMGYTDHPTGHRNGPKTELLIEVMENCAPNGPIRWIAADAFIGFCQIHVEPLDATELRN